MRHAKISSGLKMHQTKIEVRFQTVSENVRLPSNFGGVLGAVVGVLTCPIALNAMRSNIEKRGKTEPSPSSTSWIVHHNQRDHGHDHHQSWKQTCIILQTPTNLIIANCLSTASPWHRFWVDLRLFWCKRKCSTYRFQIVQKLSFKTIMRDDFGVDACQKKINLWRLH